MEMIEVFGTVKKLLNWSAERNKMTVDYGVKYQLCMSEIHIIEMIGEQPGILQIQLCEQTGLTKGRVSVIVSNLVKKEMVIRNRTLENKKEMPLMLTSMGKTAYLNHKERDLKIFQEIQNVMSLYSEQELEHFNAGILQTIDILQRYT